MKLEGNADDFWVWILGANFLLGAGWNPGKSRPKNLRGKFRKFELLSNFYRECLSSQRQVWNFCVFTVFKFLPQLPTNSRASWGRKFRFFAFCGHKLLKACLKAPGLTGYIGDPQAAPPKFRGDQILVQNCPREKFINRSFFQIGLVCRNDSWLKGPKTEKIQDRGESGRKGEKGGEWGGTTEGRRGREGKKRHKRAARRGQRKGKQRSKGGIK